MIKKLFISLAVSLNLLLVFTAVPAMAQSQKQEACEGAGGTFTAEGDCISDDGSSLGETLKDITNIIIFIVGAVAVLMLIIGGLRYVLSGGDSAGVEGAKNTILYAIIGIIVAFMSYAIVNFVLSSIID